MADLLFEKKDTVAQNNSENNHFFPLILVSQSEINRNDVDF